MSDSVKHKKAWVTVDDVAQFLKSIVEKTDFAPSFEDGVQVQKVLAAVEKSAVERRWISVH